MYSAVCSLELADEPAEVAQEFEADLVLTEDCRVFRGHAEPWVGILAVDCQPQEPGHVVDAGAMVGKPLRIDAQIPCEITRGELHVMA